MTEERQLRLLGLLERIVNSLHAMRKDISDIAADISDVAERARAADKDDDVSGYVPDLTGKLAGDEER